MVELIHWKLYMSCNYSLMLSKHSYWFGVPETYLAIKTSYLQCISLFYTISLLEPSVYLTILSERSDVVNTKTIKMIKWPVRNEHIWKLYESKFWKKYAVCKHFNLMFTSCRDIDNVLITYWWSYRHVALALKKNARIHALVSVNL